MVFTVLAVSCATMAFGQAEQSGLIRLGERVVRFPADFNIGRYVLIDEDDIEGSDEFPRRFSLDPRYPGFASPVDRQFSFDTGPYPDRGFNSGDAQGEIRVAQGMAINLVIRCKDTRYLSQLGPGEIQHLLIERRGGVYRYVLEDIEHLTGLRALTLHAPGYHSALGTYWGAGGSLAFSDRDLESLQQLRSLRRLDLSNANFPDAALRHIEGLKSLRVVDLSSTNVTDAGIERLAAMPQLAAIDLSQVRLSAKGLSYLKRLPALQELSLGPVSATFPGLEQLQHLTALTRLRIEITDASDDALRRFRPPPNLKHLELESKHPVTDAGLTSLAGLGRLESLKLWLPVKITGGGLEEFGDLESLKELAIRRVEDATDEGLASLAGLTQVERLRVFSIPDVAALLRHLERQPNLVELTVTGDLDPRAEIPKLTSGPPRLRRLCVPTVIHGERYAQPWAALVSQLTSLEELDFSGIAFSNRQMRLLENLVHLKRLRISPNATAAGLKSLSRLGSLEHLFLCGGKYTDAGLKHLGRLTALKTLSITHSLSASASDAGMAPLANLTSLETLDLRRALFVTDGAVEHLGHLSQLKRLNVEPTQITASGIARLRRALPDCLIIDSPPHSQPLPDPLANMSLTKPLTLAELTLLKKLTNIQELRLNTAQFADVGLEHLKDLTNVESLELSSSEITDAELVHLKGLTNLRSLQLHFNTRVTDAGLEQLSGLTSLRNLSLSGTQVTDAGLRHLKGLVNLQELRPPKQTTDAGLEHLRELTSLRELHLSFTQMTDAGLEHLAGLTNLRDLSLSGTQVTSIGLEHLRELTNLQELALSDTQVTSVGLEHLRGLAELRSLGLHNTQVTDAGLVHLQGLSNLEILGLNSTKVTDAGLEHLGGLIKLGCLMLEDTQVTDAGLVHLKRLRHLWNLRSSGTRVTNEGIENLQKDLPNLYLVDRRGA